MPDPSTPTSVPATVLPPAAGTGHTPGGFPYRQHPHRYCGNDSDRQSVGDPGHCEDCCSVGHVAAHPDLGCGDVGCTSDHEVFELDVPMVVVLKSGNVRPLTHNDRFHWRRKAKLVGEIREAVHWAAKTAKVPTGAQHLTVQLHYAPGSARSVTDAPNLTATSKPAIDGLVDAKVVPDDTDKHVTERMPVIHTGPGKRRLWLVVEVQR